MRHKADGRELKPWGVPPHGNGMSCCGQRDSSHVHNEDLLGQLKDHAHRKVRLTDHAGKEDGKLVNEGNVANEKARGEETQVAPRLGMAFPDEVVLSGRVRKEL
jgi:hypothetical protein